MHHETFPASLVPAIDSQGPTGGPVEIDPSLLQWVAGGSPRGGWLEPENSTSSPRGGWTEPQS